MRRVLIILIIILVGCAATNKANKFYEAGDYENAIAECQLILKTDSLNTNAYFIIGKCYHAQGKLRQAIESLTTAYKMDPASFSSGKYKSELIKVKLQYADSLIDQENHQSALNQLKSIHELDSTNVNGLSELSDLYFDLGILGRSEIYYRKLLVLQKENQQIQQRLDAIKERTQEADKYCRLGKESFEKYQYKKAVKQSEHALDSKADHQDAKYYLAMANGAILYKKGGKSELWDAIEQFGKAMSLRPKSSEPHYYLGLAYEKKDRREFDNAIREYKTVLEKEPYGRFAKDSQKRVKELTALRDKLKKFLGK